MPAAEASPQGGIPAEGARQGFPIVGIGASAGGLAAYEAFFSALPDDADAGMAFVVVQHLSPDHKSMLVDLVRRYVKMTVHEIEDGMEVEQNHVYIIPPNKDLTLDGKRLRLFAPSEPRGQRLPIDIFFRSLASEQHDRAICIVLSGTGSDGTLGARAVKGEGGMVMAQDPATTEHSGMPKSAIATGMVDYVLPPAGMPAQLIAYARHAFDGSRPSSRPVPGDDGSIKRLTSLLRAQTGHDFSQYKSTTLLRRMGRRMALHQIAGAEEYFRYARENPTEIEGLFRDLLIGVTNLFRDPEAFKALEQVLSRILDHKSAHDHIRVWVCGCSTGEEAYSIAILIQEQLEARKLSLRVQVFATDIDHLAIETARAGVYPASIVADVTPDRLQRFFVHDAERDTYRVQKIIRDMLVFSEQDVIRDAPFSKLDLISCRNLLIYLNGEVQRKLIPLFHYALAPGGALFLGSSETTGEFSRLFTPLDRKWRIYLRETVEPDPTRPGLTDFVPMIRGHRDRQRPVTEHRPTDPVGSWRHLTEQALLAHYAEAGVLVNGRGDILYIMGKTGKYLEPAAGDAVLNILAMAREGLRRELTTALHKAVAHRQPVSSKGLRVRSNGGHCVADLAVAPVHVPYGGGGDLYLVVLEEVPQDVASAAAGDATIDPGSRVAELEHELKAKEEYLQTTLEEMETTNEELKSTNEEMQSVNEELQSTNEELETSKEELQSVNEELSTVNAELQDKVSDLSRVNNDMNNLLAGTGVGTIFVDNNLRILRFTPTAIQVINLIASDVGRPVEHIVSNLVGYPSFMDDLREVLDTLVAKEAEVVAKNGASYLMRIRPYRTIENTIEGVVLTFVDISERKRAEHALRRSEERFNALFNQAFAGVAETDLSGRFTYVNDRFCEMTGYSRAALLQMTMQQLTHADDIPRADVLREALVAGGSDFSIEKRYRRRDGTGVWVAERVSAIRSEHDKVSSVVAISFDLSERKRLEAEADPLEISLATDHDALARLEAVASLALSAGNRQAVFDEIVEAALVINRADMGMLQLRFAPDEPLVVVAQRGFAPSFVDYWNTEAGGDGGNGSSSRAVGYTVDDLKRTPAPVTTPLLEVYVGAGVRALQTLPVVTRNGAVIGVLSTHFREPRHPDARRTRMLDILARQVADMIAQSDRGPELPPFIPAVSGQRQ